MDVGFWGGAVPGNTGRMRELHAAGAFGFKVFLADSGVTEFPPVDRAGLAGVMAEAAALGSLVIVHAEDAAVLAAAPPPPGGATARSCGRGPAAAEVAAIGQVIDLAGRTGARAHVLHLSAADAIGLVAAAAPTGSGHRGDLPALPRAGRGGHPGRRHAVQVLPAGPRARQPRAALAGAGRRDHRLRGI